LEDIFVFDLSEDNQFLLRIVKICMKHSFLFEEPFVRHNNQQDPKFSASTKKLNIWFWFFETFEHQRTSDSGFSFVECYKMFLP